jgi:hypothetical protein
MNTELDDKIWQLISDLKTPEDILSQIKRKDNNDTSKSSDLLKIAESRHAKQVSSPRLAGFDIIKGYPQKSSSMGNIEESTEQNVEPVKIVVIPNRVSSIRKK